MLVYLDTNIWIYAYEGDPLFGDPARRFFQNLRAQRHRMASSLFTLGELMVMPTHRSNAFAITAYRNLFASHEIVLLPYDLNAAQIYASLRSGPRLKPMDALHLATASAAGVDRFVTQDSKLLQLKVPGIVEIVDLSVPLP